MPAGSLARLYPSLSASSTRWKLVAASIILASAAWASLLATAWQAAFLHGSSSSCYRWQATLLYLASALLASLNAHDLLTNNAAWSDTYKAPLYSLSYLLLSTLHVTTPSQLPWTSYYSTAAAAVILDIPLRWILLPWPASLLPLLLRPPQASAMPCLLHAALALVIGVVLRAAFPVGRVATAATATTTTGSPQASPRNGHWASPKPAAAAGGSSGRSGGRPAGAGWPPLVAVSVLLSRMVCVVDEPQGWAVGVEERIYSCRTGRLTYGTHTHAQTWVCPMYSYTSPTHTNTHTHGHAHTWAHTHMHHCTSYPPHTHTKLASLCNVCVARQAVHNCHTGLHVYTICMHMSSQPGSAQPPHGPACMCRMHAYE